MKEVIWWYFVGDMFFLYRHPCQWKILFWEDIHGRSTKKRKVISQSVDDRTEAERGISCGSADSRMAGEGLRRQDVTSGFMMGRIVFGGALNNGKEKATKVDKTLFAMFYKWLRLEIKLKSCRGKSSLWSIVFWELYTTSAFVKLDILDGLGFGKPAAG